jgi:hypothetical protein
VRRTSRDNSGTTIVENALRAMTHSPPMTTRGRVPAAANAKEAASNLVVHVRTLGRLKSRETLGMVTAGVVVGLVAARLAAPLIASLLYGVTPTDGASLVGAGLAVLRMAAVASAIPAGQAARLDPTAALRDGEY